MSAVIASHYERHSDNNSYENAWFYSDPTYQDFLVESLREQFFDSGDQPTPQDVVVDIGCGTGKFSRLLAHGCKLKTPVYGVDPFLLGGQQDDDLFVALPPMDAVEFARQIEDVAASERINGHGDAEAPKVISRILMKEVVHHVHDDFAEICRHLAAYFRKHPASDCSLVVATRLKDPGAYPFFPKAAEAWRCCQEDADVYVRQMRANGFDEVNCEVKSFPVEMPVDQWKGMVRSRFWSNFGGLSDEDIEQGLAEMADFQEFQKESDPTRLEFKDRFVFITGRATSSHA